MPTDKIKRVITWIRKTLDITEKTSVPGTIDGTIIPVLAALGWERCEEIEFITATSAGATNLVELANVPEGEMHYFLTCHVGHDDPATSKAIRIAMRIASNVIASGVTIKTTETIFSLGFLGMDRPILVPPGARLIGSSRTNIAIGSDFTIAGHFLRLPIGEYVTGSPYG